MASVTGRAAGFIATLYYVASVDATKDLTSISGNATSGNKIKDVADMGALSNTRNIIDVPVYGADTSGKLAGQADPGTFDFNVTLNFDDATHLALKDDDGTTERTFIIKFTQGSNETYACFDGFIADGTVNQPIDDRISMDVSVARSGGITWVDAA
jgi:acyl-CoA synthetase (AMP-forming)/AMP-acid ligase II